jgi:hypothetical protein
MNRKRWFNRILLTFLAALALACTSIDELTAPDFMGFVMEVQPDGEGDVIGVIRAESHADKIVTRYVITVTEDTVFSERRGDEVRRSSLARLEKGQWLQVWFSEPPIGFHPLYGTAMRVHNLGFDLE